MLTMRAAVLILLWLLGLLAFQANQRFHLHSLVVGIVLLVLHFVRGSQATT
jgi:hypothetical protein